MFETSRPLYDLRESEEQGEHRARRCLREIHPRSWRPRTCRCTTSSILSLIIVVLLIVVLIIVVLLVVGAVRYNHLYSPSSWGWRWWMRREPLERRLSLAFDNTFDDDDDYVIMMMILTKRDGDGDKHYKICHLLPIACLLLAPPHLQDI